MTDVMQDAVGVEMAARFVEKRRDDYVQEHGSYDPDTGMTEFPGTGEEYVGELEEIIEGIRSLLPPVPVNSYEEMRAALEKAADMFEGLSYIHDGNPSLPLADMEPVDYARHMLSEARQMAREAHKEARAALDGAQS